VKDLKDHSGEDGLTPVANNIKLKEEVKDKKWMIVIFGVIIFIKHHHARSKRVRFFIEYQHETVGVK
jgi:hypothetical protein